MPPSSSGFTTCTVTLVIKTFSLSITMPCSNSITSPALVIWRADFDVCFSKRLLERDFSCENCARSVWNVWIFFIHLFIPYDFMIVFFFNIVCLFFACLAVWILWIELDLYQQCMCVVRRFVFFSSILFFGIFQWISINFKWFYTWISHRQQKTTTAQWLSHQSKLHLA